MGALEVALSEEDLRAIAAIAPWKLQPARSHRRRCCWWSTGLGPHGSTGLCRSFRALHIAACILAEMLVKWSEEQVN